MKKLFALMMAGILAFSMVACGSGTPAETPDTDSAGSESGANAASTESEPKTSGIKLGISNGYYGNTWRAQYVEAMEGLCDELVADGTLSEYTLLNSTGDVTEELNNINSLISDGVDVLMISPNSPTSMGSVIQTALDQGIFVVIFNDAAAYEGTYCIYNDQAQFWEIQAKWFAEKLGGKGNMVWITGSSGNSTSTCRQNAAKAVLDQYPDIKILASAPGEWSETTAQSVMSTFLSTYGEEIDAVMAEDVMSNGIIRAYENAGMTPTLISGDYQKSFIDWAAQHPEIESIGSPSVPSIGTSSIKIALRLYWGDELADGVLQPNQEDESLVNAIILPMPFVIVSNPDDVEGPWTEGYNDTQFISAAEASKLCEGQPDSYMLDMEPPAEQLEALFK